MLMSGNLRTQGDNQSGRAIRGWTRGGVKKRARELSSGQDLMFLGDDDDEPTAVM
jgi:hypothetical protein